MQEKAGLDAGRAARLFVPVETMADTLLARVDAAHGTRRPAIATVAHAAALRRMITKRLGAK